MRSARLASFLTAAALLSVSLAPGLAVAQRREPAVRLAVLPVVIEGAEGKTSLSEIYDAVSAGARLRPGLGVISSEEMFVANQDGLAERVRDCGPDSGCIASRLRSFNARLGMVVILNFQLQPALVSVQLLDTDDGRELGRSLGELAPGDDLAARLRKETAAVLVAAGYPEGGRLLVEVDPSAAQVAVAGQEPDRATPNLFVVPEGRYEVRAFMEGFEPASTRAEVTSGQESRVRLSLERSSSLFSSPWFWTAVGIVAVGASVGAVLGQPDPNACICFTDGNRTSCDRCG